MQPTEQGADPIRQVIGDLMVEIHAAAAGAPPFGSLRGMLLDWKDRLGKLEAALLAAEKELESARVEAAKWLSPNNENAKRGYLVAMIRDLAQAKISAMDYAEEAMRQLQAKLAAESQKNEPTVETHPCPKCRRPVPYYNGQVCEHEPCVAAEGATA